MKIELISEKVHYSTKFKLLKVSERLSSAWFMPIYSVYLHNAGLSLFQLNLINFAYMTVLSATDPFTGRFGDKKGHVRIYLVGMIFWSVAALVYGLGSVVIVFLIAETLAAVARALMSNALEARLKNTASNDKVYSKVRADADFAATILALGASSLSTLLVDWFDSPALPWYLSAATGLVTILLGRVLYSNEIQNEIATAKEFTPELQLSIKDGFKIVSKNRKLRFAAIVLTIGSFAFQPFNMYWSIHFEQQLGSVGALGTLAGLMILLVGVGKWLVGKVDPMSWSYKWIAVQLLGIGGLLLVSAQSNSAWLIIGAFLAHEIFRGTLPLSVDVLFNRNDELDEIPERSRAHLNSVLSGLMTAGSATGLLTFGLLTEWLSISEVWSVSALFLLSSSLILWRYR